MSSPIAALLRSLAPRTRRVRARLSDRRREPDDSPQSIADGLGRLDKLSQTDYWQERARRHDRQLHTSLRRQRARARLAQGRIDARVGLSFLCPAAWPGVTAIALIIATELVAWALHLVAWSPLDRLTNQVQAASYETLAAAAVTAEAAFLALFYTTVGVIASTAYQNVPSDVRRLFVEERAGSVYARGVVRALVFGIAVLTANAVAYRPHALSVVVLALLSMIAIFRLLVLGTGLFNFFDPATLSQPLPGRFDRATVQASAADTAFDEATQQTAHTSASLALRLYREIVVLMTSRTAHDTSASTTVVRDLLLLAAKYAAAKPAIPIGSRWWAQTPEHPNWLTLDHTQLQMALATSTGVVPKLVPDPFWVEREVAALLTALLSGLATDRQVGSAVQLVDNCDPLLHFLAGQLQADAALIYQSAVSAAMITAATSARSTSGELTTSMSDLERMAAAERSVMPLTQIWLGYVRAAQVLIAQDLGNVFDKAASGREALYSAGLPRPLVEMFERFIDSIDTEIAAEGRRITPTWWVRHQAARVLTAQLRMTHDRIVGELEKVTLAPARAATDAGDYQLGAVVIFAALELFDKIDTHHTTVTESFTALGRLRSSSVGDEDAWSSESDPTEQIAALREQATALLGVCLPHLRTVAHESDRPDLYGQAYQVLFETVFDALLNGEADQARRLFPSLFVEAGAARDRLVTDLADQEVQVRLIYSGEPLIGLMELSGYALLMQQIDSDGIWDDVRTLWDAWLQANAAISLPEFLLGLIATTQSIFALTHGNIARTGRVQQLSHRLSERGIIDRSSGWWPGRSKPSTPHLSPIVSAFAPSNTGLHEELADLFMVEYLSKHLPPGTSLPHSADMLAERIARFREDADADDGEGGADEQS